MESQDKKILNSVQPKSEIEIIQRMFINSTSVTDRKITLNI